MIRFLVVVISLFIVSDIKTFASQYSESDSIRSEETFRTLLLNDSIIMPDKISIYHLTHYFSSPFLGNDIEDDFYNLYRGKKVNMNRYGNLILTNPTEIMTVMNEFNEAQLLGRVSNGNTTLMGSVIPFLVRQNIEVGKNIVLHYLIVLHFKERPPLILLDCANKYLFCKGYKFSLEDATYFKQISYDIPKIDDGIMF